MNADAVTQYDSEINALADLNVERLAIGVGDESNVAEGSALWMIDNNPAKDLGVLPIQALDLEELSSALKHLCILNTDPPTQSPSSAPSGSPTKSPAPSRSPTDAPSKTPTDLPTISPAPTFLLPDCYDGPKLVKKDSSDLVMCHYNQDMVQINDMNNAEESISGALFSRRSRSLAQAAGVRSLSPVVKSLAPPESRQQRKLWVGEHQQSVQQSLVVLDVSIVNCFSLPPANLSGADPASL